MGYSPFSVPTLTRWFLRSALLYLVAGLGASALLWCARAGWIPPVWQRAGPAVLHLLTVGWLTQTIWGVAFWMLPPASRERPRGREGLLQGAFVLLNCGLLLRILAEPARGDWTANVLIASAGLQFAAGAIAATALWPRIRSAAAPREVG